MSRPDWDSQFAETEEERQERWAKRRVAERAPFTDPTKPIGSIFRDHSCYRCDSGNKPCVKGAGHERECDTLHARND